MLEPDTYFHSGDNEGKVRLQLYILGYPKEVAKSVIMYYDRETDDCEMWEITRRPVFSGLIYRVRQGSCIWHGNKTFSTVPNCLQEAADLPS